MAAVITQVNHLIIQSPPTKEEMMNEIKGQFTINRMPSNIKQWLYSSKNTNSLCWVYKIDTNPWNVCFSSEEDVALFKLTWM